jgi:multiple sugar transport system substrate-binding protein
MKETCKNIWIFAAVAALLLAAMPVCAGGQQEGGAAAPMGEETATATMGPGGYPAYTGPPVTLQETAWTSNENYSNDLFMAAYPQIKVEWTDAGVNYEQILTATAAGAGLPDVIMSEYTYAPQFMTYGSYQAINKWVSRDTYLKYYPEVTLKWCAMDGQIYGTPQDSGACTMVYRKDIFDKYSLTVPKTWAEFATQAAKLHAADPSISMISYPSNFVLVTMGLVWQAGGKMFDYADGKWYIDFTNPTAMKVFQFWQKLLRDGSVTAEAWWNADWYKGLADGKAATVLCGGWFPEWLQLNCKTPPGTWRVAVPPQWDASNPTNGEMGGSGFYVGSQCKNPEAAALFVLWLNSAKESLVQLHEKSQLPILWSKTFTRELAPELANVEYEYFGGQKITPVSVEALKLVNTAFTALPIMSNVSSTHNEENAKFVDGSQDAATFLKNWETSTVSFMKKQGFTNVVVGKLP